MPDALKEMIEQYYWLHGSTMSKEDATIFHNACIELEDVRQRIEVLYNTYPKT